jgi:hypothetical protein
MKVVSINVKNIGSLGENLRNTTSIAWGQTRFKRNTRYNSKYKRQIEQDREIKNKIERQTEQE